ncbi:MAG: hypothetical protein WKF48_05825 [Solirubrobacteraceae bacterium]
MFDLPQIITLCVALGTAIVGILGYFKFKPGQREQVNMNVAEATMSVAHGTFQLVTTELEDQFKRMAGEMAEMRGLLTTVQTEANQLREDLTTVKNKLISATERLDAVTSERDKLRERVRHLEERLARFEAPPPP